MTWPSEKIRRERRTDSAIARARRIPPWQLRRERYLMASGRMRELIDEEAALKRKRKEAEEQSAGSFPRFRRDL